MGQPRQQAVLGILAMRANRVISRGELVDAVWGQDPPASAEGGIYTYVAGLRRVIEPTRSARGPGRVLVSSGAGYVLHLVPGQPDAVAFEQQVARARQLRKNGDPVAAVDALEGALGLWRGVAFAGVPGPFAETERVRLAELRSGAAEERADVLLSLGRHEEVVPDLTALVADHPLRERMRGLLMIALYRGGRHAEALRVFADGRHVLAEELGIDPGTELSRIHQQVLTCDPALNLAADATRDGHLDQASGSARPRPQAAGTGPRGSDEPVLPLPAQLPLDAQGFSGRHDELRTLHDMLPSARAAETVPVAVISGTAGVGKTALAIRFGHQVAKHFPDGQLYINLRGRDPGRPPMEPIEALGVLLVSFGMPPHRLTSSTEERAALFRSLVDGKRILAVLDNASNAAQVRPLLPGSPDCLVVVTSRNQMAGLVAAEGATLISLDVLGDDEAHEMLARRLGRERVAAEPQAADEIIAACAGLPLALSIAVGRATAGRAKRPLAQLAAELRDARNRLDALEEGDAATDVRAVLSWSYDQLSPAAARMFRLLGLHPGPDISLSAAASLAGISRAEAGTALRELTRTHMAAEHLPGRFTFHDLLRVYATDQAERHDPEPERSAAVQRMLDHYLHTAMAASQRFSPFRSPLRLATPQPGVLPAEMADKDQAMAWFDAEAPVLLTLIEYASANGFDTHAWQIPWTLGPFFHRRGRWRSYAASQRTALAAAQRLDDTLALAHAHHLLGHAQLQMSDLRVGRAELPARPGPVPRTAGPGQRGGGAQRPGRHAGEAGALSGGAGRRAGRAADAQGRRALVDPGHAGERGRLAVRPPGPVRRRAEPLPAGAEPAPGIGPPRRRGRHPGQPGLRLPAPRRPGPGPGPLPAGHRRLPGDRRAVRRGQLAGRAGRRAAPRRRPGRGPDAVPAGRRDPGRPAAPARRRHPGQARRPGPGPGRRGRHHGPFGIKERKGYGAQPGPPTGPGGVRAPYDD